MVLAGPDLTALIKQGVIDAPIEQVNASSINVRIAPDILTEDALKTPILIDPQDPQPMLRRITMPPMGYKVDPGEFFLASTIEKLALPDSISAKLSLRSSVARLGIEHMEAGWIDAGFHGTITLELKNMWRSHGVLIRPGVQIAQLTFYQHRDAGSFAYRNRGRYNGQDRVQMSKGF